MDQARRLKLGAIFFTIFWIGGMLWWSGEYHPAYIIILAICGTIAEATSGTSPCAGCFNACICFR